MLVHQYFGKSMSANKGNNGTTNQIVYYTPDKSVCHCLYKIKWKVVAIIISWNGVCVG